jgi:hypothetical protein
MNTTTTTDACSIGRPNILIEAHELFRWTEMPTALRMLRLDGRHCFIVHRDARNHPHCVPAQYTPGTGVPFVTNIDNVRIEATTITDVVDGDKIAFDRKGDVWTLTLDRTGFPNFVEC